MLSIFDRYCTVSFDDLEYSVLKQDTQKYSCTQNQNYNYIFTSAI